MDRRRLELQIRAIVITYHAEARRNPPIDLDRFRDEARSVLDRTELLIGDDPELREHLEDARREVLDDARE